MRINPIQLNNYQNFNGNGKNIFNGKNTGYGCLATLGLTVISGACHNKYMRKAHLPLGILTVALATLHLGIIESYKH